LVSGHFSYRLCILLSANPSITQKKFKTFLTKTITFRVKKLSAILLISIFAFSQYARQLSYLECKFSNSFKVNTLKCDCEKQGGFDKEASTQLPVSKTHTHSHFDELFPSGKEMVIDCYFMNLQLTLVPLRGDDECEGKYAKPWQPPNA
jgi:hypothetical protein